MTPPPFGAASFKGGKCMELWRGAFIKHRDYLHDSWFEHELADGGSYGVAEDYPLEARLNPVDMSEYNGTRTHFVIRIILHGGQSYDYLVPADKNDHYPNREEIKSAIDSQNETALPSGVKRQLSSILTPESFALWSSVSEEPGTFNANQT
jgi:hypothetical protein